MRRPYDVLRVSRDVRREPGPHQLLRGLRQSRAAQEGRAAGVELATGAAGADRGVCEPGWGRGRPLFGRRWRFLLGAESFRRGGS